MRTELCWGQIDEFNSLIQQSSQEQNLNHRSFKKVLHSEKKASKQTDSKSISYKILMQKSALLLRGESVQNTTSEEQSRFQKEQSKTQNWDKFKQDKLAEEIKYIENEL